MKNLNQITLAFLAGLVILTLQFCNPFAAKDDSGENNTLLGLAWLASQPREVPGEINFRAILNNKDVECGSTTYTLPGTQTVQMRDLRFFIQEARLIQFDGSKRKVTITPRDNFQIVDGENTVSLLDFTRVGSGRCTGTSDDANTNTKITGNFPKGNYKGIEFDIGVPPKLNHIDPSQQASTSPLKSATGLTWNWQAGYKFIRFELTATGGTNQNFVLHLGSTNCTGDINAGTVTCANSYRPTIVVEPSGGFNPDTDTITMDLDEIFRGNGGVPTGAYADGTALSCMPIGNGAGNNGTPTTCGPILRNLGLVPGTVAGFSAALAGADSGKGTVNLATQQPIFKVVR